jgi:hypothetical protein
MAAVLALLLAHDSTVSSSRLELGEREVRATFTFSLEDLAALARLDLDRDGTVDPEEWRRVLPSIVDYVGRKFRIENGADLCTSEGEPGSLPPALSLSEGRAPVAITLRYRSSRPLARLRVHCTLFDEHGGNPRHVAELSGGRTIIFDRDRKRSEDLPAGPAAPGRVPKLGLAAVAASLILGATAFKLRGGRAAGP